MSGYLRKLRVFGLHAIGRADLWHAGAGSRALHHGGLGAAAGSAVPVGRGALRVQARGCAGGLRIGEHHAPNLPRRGQFRPPCRRLGRGGLAMGYEKFVMDADQAGMMQTMLAGVDLSENGQALDAIREVGPGKHFLGCAHTQANFETAFYRSQLADNNSVEQWEAEGSQDMAQRANVIWKRMLRDYEAPPIDPAVDEALLAFIAQRKASFPDSNV